MKALTIRLSLQPLLKFKLTEMTYPSALTDVWALIHRYGDWNEDGKKDLIIGGEDGRVVFLMNEDASENPVFDTIQFVLANVSDLDVGFSREGRSALK